ncbi:hypothetical protein KHQ81_14175 [Mycoplasmatota bacterium]|nr:hypothetical protein KHQ81_14175 [Mycoplasmatota bacterium]
MKEYIWFFLSYYPQNPQKQTYTDGYDDFMIFGIIFILIGLFAIIAPHFFALLRMLSSGWMYEDATPSDEYILFVRICGVVGVIVGIIFVIIYFINL